MSDADHDLVIVDDVVTPETNGEQERSVEVLRENAEEESNEISCDNNKSCEEEEDKYEREDIEQAAKLVEEVRSDLQFSDDETLQQALEKVKERPLIDAAFDKKLNMLQTLRNNEDFDNFHETIDEALVHLQEVQVKASEGKTTLSRSCEILNEVLPVFEKACIIYGETVELSDTVNENLIKCDRIRGQEKECVAFERQDINEAKRLEKLCDNLLDEAVKASKEHVQIVLNKQKEEKEADILTWFESTRGENMVKMDYLTADFQQMKDNCDEDIKLTNEMLNMQRKKKEDAFKEFGEKDASLKMKIEQDLDEEKQLEQQLCIVREHRKNLEVEREKRQLKQDEAVKVHKKTEDDLELLLDKFSNLLAKAGVANDVLKQTKDVCNKLFDKAVESKKIKNDELACLLKQCKKMSHHVMIAQAVNCKNASENYHQAAKFLQNKIMKQNVKLKELLQLKLEEPSNEIKEKLKKFGHEFENKKKIYMKNDEKLGCLLEECKILENEFQETNIELETFDDAFKRFKQTDDGADFSIQMPSI